MKGGIPANISAETGHEAFYGAISGGLSGGGFGNYSARKETPAAMRSLAPGSTNILSSYQVVKPFPVQVGISAPAFGQVGGGTQYFTPVQIKYLVQLRYLIRLN